MWGFGRRDIEVEVQDYTPLFCITAADSISITNQVSRQEIGILGLLLFHNGKNEILHSRQREWS
jgi:hypothetical protein